MIIAVDFDDTLFKYAPPSDGSRDYSGRPDSIGEPIWKWINWAKEMQKTGTPAGCLPVLREGWFPEDGSKVRVRNPQGLSPQSSRLYAGKVGRVTESHKDTGLCYVAFDTSWGRFWASELEHVA